MSYQVLARKWRSRTFKELVGQAHVLQALVNALDNNRLHHAYLFTGTRGVGKTSIARILAKCLNCETGVTSEPCGECSSCREIDEGRFVDLIEVDAASRTRLEDTKELLDNVQYAPARGRFKVYLIDEVHMLSTHSFNALLKTLEEPPPHVKFLLATTDPHKLPITILSRCLQFSLKNMPPEKVVEHLQHVLDSENVAYELPALWQLGRSADGSMRDALSLTDQAIAYCGDKLTSQSVTAMLGTIDQDQVYKVLDALIAGQAGVLLGAISELAEHSPDYVAVLSDMLSALHRVALAQAVPDVVDNSQGDRERILAIAGQVTSEDLQLYYQTGLIGRRDLPLAPDPRSGFEMVMLRMLAFRPDGVPAAPEQPLPGSAAVAPSTVPPSTAPSVTPPEPTPPPVTPAPASAPESAAPVTAPVQEASPLPEPVTPPPQTQTTASAPAREPQDSVSNSSQSEAPAEKEDPEPGPASSPAPAEVEPPSTGGDMRPQPPPWDDHSVSSGQAVVRGAAPVNSAAPEPVPAPSRQTTSVAPQSVPSPAPQSQPVVEQAVKDVARQDVEVVENAPKLALTDLKTNHWIPLSHALKMGGVTGAIVSHCEMVNVQGNKIALTLDKAHDTLYNDTHCQRIQDALSDYFETAISLTIDAGDVMTETPAAWRERRRLERLEAARQSFMSDDRVLALVEAFSGQIKEQTIEPVG